MPFKSEFCKYEGAKTGDQTKLRAADLQDAVRENPDYLGPGRLWQRNSPAAARHVFSVTKGSEVKLLSGGASGIRRRRERP